MKKYVMALLAGLFLCLSLNAFSATQDHKANNHTNLYFFWSERCPHCVAAHPFLEKLKGEFPNLRVHSYETNNRSNSQRYAQMASKHGGSGGSVPAFFVCGKMIVGYSGEKSTGAEIRQAIRTCY